MKSEERKGTNMAIQGFVMGKDKTAKRHNDDYGKTREGSK